MEVIMNKLLLAVFTCFLANIPASCQAMFRARLNTATRVAKSYYQPVIQAAEKPFLARIQKSVEKRFPTPQFKSYAQPENKTPVLHSHKKLISGLSNSELNWWENRINLLSSVGGLGHAALANYPIFLTLDPTQQFLKALLISGQIGFLYFGTKKLIKDQKEMKQLHGKLSSLNEEQKLEFKLSHDIQ